MSPVLLQRPVAVPRSRPPVHRVAVAGLLTATAALHLWGLSASGWANAYYSAAAQAGGASWSAWFFGASDAAGAISVDKPPAALWVMGLSVRLFGLSSWSVLVPQALMGVAAVALLHCSVRRTAGTAAGLLAGAALALTPVAVLIFRFNNPDALLTLLLVAAAYATLRAVEHGATRWLLLAAALVGLGFLTKMLQAFLVVPALAAVWLLAAPVGLARRLRDLVLAAVTLVVSAGWWVLVVELWPADARPYVGGSQTDSVLELVLGYNGFGRLTGEEVGSVGGATGGGSIDRLLSDDLAGQASWLLPAALLGLVALLWHTRRTPRTDPVRAAALLWGGWLLVTGLVFSLMDGIFHSYYLVVLAPPIAALVGIGAVVLWRSGRRTLLAGGVLGSAVWAGRLLAGTPGWPEWPGWAVAALGVVAAGGLLAPAGLLSRRVVRTAVVTTAVVATLAGPAAHAVATAAQPRSGALPTAGPGGGFGGAGDRGGPPPGLLLRAGSPGGGDGTTVGRPPRAGSPWGADGDAGGPGGALDGLLGAPEPSEDVVAELLGGDDGATWLAAAVGSNNAAVHQLATGRPVMAVGGFNGTDPAPTLAEFQALVAEGRIGWFIGGTGPGGTGSGGSDQARRIAEWVAATFPVTTVEGVDLHDLTPSAAAP